MIYNQLKPDNHWLVNQFEEFKTPAGVGEVIFLPRTELMLIFHFKNPPKLRKPIETTLPEIFIVPVINRSIELFLDDEMDAFTVCCKPSVFSKVVELNLHPNQHFHHAYTKCWLDLHLELTMHTTLHKRAECFIQYVDSYFTPNYIADEVDCLFSKIIQHPEIQSLSQLTTDCCHSMRTIERAFMQRIGLSPKALMKLVRIHTISKKSLAHSEVNSMDMVVEGNYFDQAHFIREFKSIVGTPPFHFFRNDLDMSRYFLGLTDNEKSLNKS